MQAKIAVYGVLRFPTEKVASILPHLKAMVEATREHDGCIAYYVAEDIFDPGLFRISELWPDLESLQRHSQAPHIPPWHAALRESGVLERKYTIYDITGERAL